MIVKDVASGDEAKKKLIEAINKVADCVSSTLGARGRLVMIETDGGKTESTKDGWRTLNSIHFNDSYESVAVELLKESLTKTMEVAGDNTTTTAVIAQALINKSHALVAADASPIDIKNQIEKSRDLVLSELEKLSQPLTEKLIYDVARTSANGDDEIAKIVTDAFIKAGESGNVSFNYSGTDDTYLEHVDGTLYESGYGPHEHFVNVQAERAAFFNDSLVLVSEIHFKTKEQLIPFWEAAAAAQRPLVIISEMEFNLLNAMMANCISPQSPLTGVVISPAGIGARKREMLEDIAMICGTKTLSSLDGDHFAGRAMEFLGEASSVNCTKLDTIFKPIANASREKIEGKISELKAQAANTKFALEKRHINDRISKLTGGVSMIKVGAVVESELSEKYDRMEDAVFAVRAAREEGIVAGGGMAFFEISKNPELDESTKFALQAPISKIFENAVASPMILAGLKYPVGLDVMKYEEVDMIERGILDCTKALKNAYINAVSVSNTLLMTNFVITKKRVNDGK